MSESFKVKGLRSRQAQAISLRFYVAAFYKGIHKSASAPAVGVYKYCSSLQYIGA